MYYLTTKEQAAARYFLNLDTFTENDAENAIRFCCSVTGCTREESAYLLEWWFDGVYGDLQRFGCETFIRLLDYCADAWVIGPDEPNYTNTVIAACGSDGMITGALMPTGRLFGHDL